MSLLKKIKEKFSKYIGETIDCLIDPNYYKVKNMIQKWVDDSYLDCKKPIKIVYTPKAFIEAGKRVGESLRDRANNFNNKF